MCQTSACPGGGDKESAAFSPASLCLGSYRQNGERWHKQLVHYGDSDSPLYSQARVYEAGWVRMLWCLLGSEGKRLLYLPFRLTLKQ